MNYRSLLDECVCDNADCTVRATCLRWRCYDPATTEHISVIHPKDSGPMCRYYWYVALDSEPAKDK